MDSGSQTLLYTVYFVRQYSMGRNFNDYLEKFNKMKFERILERYRYERVVKILKLIDQDNLKRILEIGPGLNSFCRHFSGEVVKDVVEPIDYLYDLQIPKNDTKKINFLNIDIESFLEVTNEKYDLIIASSVLHEIQNLRLVLSKLVSKLSIGAYIIIVVPNNQSIHRLIGLDMGITKQLHELTSMENDMQQFHSFSMKSLSEVILDLGLKIVRLETGFLKFLPHKVLDNLIENELLEEAEFAIFDKLSQFLPTYGAEIFLLAKKNEI